MKADTLFLWFLGNPAIPAYVGELNYVVKGKGVSLRYGSDWLENGFALSGDLPLTDAEFLPPTRMQSHEPRAVGAVDDARPDRWGEKVIRFIDRPERQSLMEFLYYAGDERFGALGVSTSASSYTPRAGGPIPRLEDAQQLSEVAQKINASEPLTEQEARIISGGGSPLGGAKPKAIIAIEGKQWLIKFFNNEPVDLPLIEHAAMTLAARAGITVATTQVIPLEGSNAIAVARFDRDDGRRIHSISAGTAIRAASIAGIDPDLGYPQLAEVLRRSGVTDDDQNMRDVRELFRRMVFNILIDNTDDHEKNHSLLIARPELYGTMRLAPAYDIVPSGSGQGHQEFICGIRGQESSLENAMSECSMFALRTVEAAQIIQSVIEVVNEWKAHFRQVGVCETDIAYLACQIDGAHLLSQRQSFDLAAHSSPPASGRKRKNPFSPGSDEMISRARRP